MTNPTPHSSHSEDARADEGSPTDAVTDEVRQDAAEAENHDPRNSDGGAENDGPVDQDLDFPDAPALTHP